MFVIGCKSTLWLISTGVVQGSVLGPLIFIIYSSDLVKSSRVQKFSLYADDTCLSLASNLLPSLMDVFNSEVANVDCWFKTNYLTLNPSKSIFVILHRDSNLIPSLRAGLTIGGQVVVRVTVVRFLGVFLIERLSLVIM